MNDIAVPERGWLTRLDLDVGNAIAEGSRVGAPSTIVGTWYRAGDGGNDDGPIVRVGPFASVTWAHASRRTSAVTLLAQWHVRHRFRTGATVPSAIPYIGAQYTLTVGLSRQ